TWAPAFPVSARADGLVRHRRGLEDRRGSGLQVADACAHHRHAALEAAADLDEAFLAHAERDRAARELAVLDREDIRLPGLLAHGAGRNHGGGRRLVEDELALGEHAALQRPVAIR